MAVLTMMVDNIEEAELCKIAEKFVQEIDHSQVMAMIVDIILGIFDMIMMVINTIMMIIGFWWKRTLRMRHQPTGPCLWSGAHPVALPGGST